MESSFHHDLNLLEVFLPDYDLACGKAERSNIIALFAHTGVKFMCLA
jgi:hypothetical protein